MKITKQRLKQIIREELQAITESRAAMAGRADDAFDDLDQQTGAAPRRSQPKTKSGGGAGRAGMAGRASDAFGELDRRTASPKAPKGQSDDGITLTWDYDDREIDTDAERADRIMQSRQAATGMYDVPKMVKHRKYPGPDLGSGDKKAFRKAFAAAKKGAHKFFWFDKGKGRKPYAVK